MKELNSEDFGINIKQSDNQIIMEWFGEVIGIDTQKILRSYFEDIKQEIIGKEIQIDFRKVSIMSSTLFVELIKFLNILEKNKFQGLSFQ